LSGFSRKALALSPDDVLALVDVLLGVQTGAPDQGSLLLQDGYSKCLLKSRPKRSSLQVLAVRTTVGFGRGMQLRIVTPLSGVS